jgi:hypothetical protein
MSDTREYEVGQIIDSSKIKYANGGPSVIRLAPTRIWVVAVDDSAGSTHAIYTDTEGLSWVNGGTLTNSYGASSHVIAEGADGEPVVACRQGTAAKVDIWKYNGSTWSLQSTVNMNGLAASAINALALMYDGSTYHLITPNLASSTNNQIIEHRTSTDLVTWSSPTVIETGVSGGTNAANSRGMAAAVDRSGNVHVCYTLNYASNQYYTRYAKYTGTWSSPETIHDYGTLFASQWFHMLHGMDLAIDINDKPHLVGVASAQSHLSTPTGFATSGTDRVPFYFERTGGSWTSAEVVEDPTASVAETHWPTIHMNSGTTPVVYWGASIASASQLRKGTRGASWIREDIGAADTYASYTNMAPDAAQYARTNVGQPVSGTFMYLRGSLHMYITTGITWQDESDPVAEGATLSHSIFIKGRDVVTSPPAFSQTVALARGYSKSPVTNYTISQSIDLLRAFGRSDTRDVPFSQTIGLWYVPTGGGGDTIWRNYEENRLAFSTDVSYLIEANLGSEDTLDFSQEIHLTLGRTVPTPLDFEQVIEVQKVKLLTLDDDLLLEQVVFLNKILNLSVAHEIAFSTSGLVIRDWDAWSTHYDGTAGIDLLEDTTIQVVFMGPASLPTKSLTMMQPAFGDRRVDFRRRGAVRRNRAGQARTFATPAYSRFELVWRGIPRVIAEEFRHRVVEWLGIELIYQDHNGVQHNVIITDTEIPRDQAGLENVTLTLTLEKTGRIDESPTTAG